MPYNSKQEAVDALLPGYHVVGEKRVTSKVTNPNAGRPGEPATIDGPGTLQLSVQGPNGAPDEIEVKEVGNNPNTKGGVGFDVVTGPKSAPAKTSTPAAGLERLDAQFNVITDPKTPAVYVRDPKAAPGTQPTKIEPGSELGDPTTWTPIRRDQTDPASPVIGLYDPKSQKVAASVPAEPNAKPTGVFTNVVDPNDPSGKRVIAVVDQGDKSVHTVSQVDNKQLVTTPTAIYSVDKDSGKSTLVQTLDKSAPFQAIVTDGVRYIFDPNEKDPTKAFKRDPNQDKLPPTMKDQAGTTYVLVPDENDPSGLGGKYVLPPGITKPSTVDAPGSTSLKRIIYRDDKGNVITDVANPNYVAPQTTEGAQSTTARQIQQWNDKTGQWDWVENKGRVVASDALKTMAQQLTGQVVAGDISEDEATKMITAANARMTNDIAQQQNVTSAAGDIIKNTSQNAQTASGLLQQRAQAATGTLQSLVGNALGNKNFGAGGGNLGDIGGNLVQGLTGWTADLMGGQATMDSAARMVQAADPQSSMADPSTQAAVATLRQMLDKHQELTGQPHPAVAATQAAQQSQQVNGMAAPQTYNLNDIQWNQAANPANVPGRVMGPGGVITGPGVQAAQPVAPVQPVPVASGFTAPGGAVPGQNYGANIAYSNGWVPGTGTIPQPLPFVAPMPQPLTPQMVRGY